MKFVQDITWIKVVKILVIFFVVSLLIMALVIPELMQGGSFVACMLAVFAHLGVSLCVIATELGDLDTDLYSGNGWYSRPSASQDNFYFDPDP